MTEIFLLVTLVLAAGAGLFLLEQFIRRTWTGVAVVLAVWYFYDISALDGRPGVNLAGFQIIDTDIVFPALGVAALARLLRRGRMTGPQVAISVMGLVAAVSIVEGARQFGIAATVNESRKFLYLATGLLYFSTAQWSKDRFDRFLTIWVGFALVMVPVVLGRWVGVLPGAHDEQIPIRVIDTFYTLPLVQAAIITAPLALVPQLRIGRPKWLVWSSPVLAIVALILSHRTLWIVMIICGAMLIISTRTMRKRTMIVLSLSAVAASGIVVILTDTLAADVASQAEESVIESPITADSSSLATNTNTFRWRYLGWVALVEDFEPSLKNLMFGQPHGGGWSRMVAGQKVEVSPHNFYLEVFLRQGVTGLLLWVGLLVWVAVRWRRAPSVRDYEPGAAPLLNRSTALALTTAVSLFFLTSRITEPQYVAIGLLIASAGPRIPGLVAGRVPTTSESEQARHLDEPDTTVDRPYTKAR